MRINVKKIKHIVFEMYSYHQTHARMKPILAQLHKRKDGKVLYGRGSESVSNSVVSNSL